MIKMNNETFVCKGCKITDQSDDHIFQCTGCDEYFCDSCHQSTGRYLTEDESEDFYDEDEPEWYCKECAAEE